MDGSGGLWLAWESDIAGACGSDVCVGLRITRAEPRILVSRLLLMALLDQLQHEAAHVWFRPGPGARDVGSPASGSAEDLAAWLQQAAAALEGWVLTVADDTGRTVVYRITGKSPLIDGYEAEWPD